jgi:hypothetical protein
MAHEFTVMSEQGPLMMPCIHVGTRDRLAFVMAPGLDWWPQHTAASQASAE